MILTGSVLLFALVSAVRAYPFGNIQASGVPQTFGYNQALLQPIPPFPSAAVLQPQIYSNQDPNKIQLYNNAQRFYQHQQLLQNPKFFAGAQQHHSIQQRQVPPANTKAVQQQQPLYSGPSPLSQLTRLAPPSVPPSKTVAAAAPSPAIGSEKDFLSSLQIIDTQGRLRELRDFGLGGNGNHPEEPELERQLKNIFETINRDLENAAFLPLDMNAGGHQQLSNIFQTNQYNREATVPRPAQRLPLETDERPRLPQAVDSSRGYSHQKHQSQPKFQPQQRFQFLQPAHGTSKVAESPIRSPAQALRDGNLQENKHDEQRPIEQVPLKQDTQLPVKGKVPVEQQQIHQQPIQTQNQHNEQQLGGYQDSYKAPVQIHHREPESNARHQQLGQYQAPVEQQQTAFPVHIERKPQQIQIDQQQQQGFDDEPAALKTVERDQSKANDRSYSGPQRPAMQSFKQNFIAREKTPINQAPIQQQQLIEIQHQQQPIPITQQQQQQIRQDTLEDEHLTHDSRANAQKKFDGWVPIVQRQELILEQQKLTEPQVQSELEQVREEPGFEVQRPIVQQKEQQKSDSAPTLAVNDDHLEEQQQVSREPGRLSKIRKSIKFGSAARSKSSGEYQAADVQQTQQQEVIPDQGQQQQREDVPVQQQEEALALVVEQQRQDIIQQQDSGRKQEPQPIKTEQRRVEPTTIATTTTTTTSRPIQRNEGVKGGRKVKLQQVEKVRTPVQKARDQQTKIIKQQQQLQQQQQQQQEQQELQQHSQQPPQQLSKPAEREVKRPRQLQQATQPVRQQQFIIKQEELQQVKAEEQRQTNFEELGAPVISTVRQIPRNQEQKGQQELIKEHRGDSIELPQQQKQELTQQQDLQQTRVQTDLTQHKEEVPLAQQKVESHQLTEDLTQQKEEISQQKDEQFQQKDELAEIRVEPTQKKIEPQQQQDETVQEKIEQQQQQKLLEPVELQQKEEIVTPQREEPTQQGVEAFAQKEEANQQKEEFNQQTEGINQQAGKVTQQREDSLKGKEEPTPVRDDLSQQNEDLSQQKEEVVQQSQPPQNQDAPLQQQQEQQKQEEPAQQQQQDNAADQIGQQPDLASQQPDNVQQQQLQQTQGDNNQFQPPQQQEQRQEDNTSGLQQERQPTLIQEDEKRQDEQVKQTEEPETQVLNQEKQQAVELPQGQVQEDKTQVDEEPAQTTTIRPPTRLVRPSNQKTEGLSRPQPEPVRQEAKAEVGQEVVVPTRPKLQFSQSNRQSTKNGIQRQNNDQNSRSRFSTRQRNDEASLKNFGAQNVNRFNNEGYLSANQLLNTYNPLQFEPERISSLNRATESSSQNTNVNSSPSGESY